METHSKFAPTGFDPAGAFLDDDRQNWLMVPVSRTRDTGPLEESNFEAALEILGGESDDVEVHRFGHWGPGWFEIIIVRPGSAAETAAEEIENRLEDYPLLDEDDAGERETEAANDVWRDCYNVKERVRYIRKNRSQFEFRSLSDMLGCVRGEYFSGYASELLG